MKLKHFVTALALTSCSSFASAGLLIDSISVQMTNTKFSARTKEQRRETNDANAFDNARSAFDESFGRQGFCDLSLDTFADITAKGTCGGSKRNYGALYTVTGTTTGVTEFEFGLDWGRGGFIAFDSATDNDLIRRTDDVWWSRRWNNRDVISYVLEDVGDFTLTLLGFEGCCDGINTARYRSLPFAGDNNNRPFGPNSQLTTLAPGQPGPGEWNLLAVNHSRVPAPGSLPLLAIGAMGVYLGRRQRRSQQDSTANRQ